MAIWIDGTNKGHRCGAIIVAKKDSKEKFFFRLEDTAEISWEAYWEIKDELYSDGVVLEWFAYPLDPEDVKDYLELEV